MLTAFTAVAFAAAVLTTVFAFTAIAFAAIAFIALTVTVSLRAGEFVGRRNRLGNKGVAGFSESVTDYSAQKSSTQHDSNWFFHSLVHDHLRCSRVFEIVTGITFILSKQHPGRRSNNEKMRFRSISEEVYNKILHNVNWAGEVFAEE